MNTCNCNGTGWVADLNSIIAWEEPCDQCDAFVKMRQRATEERECRQAAYMMRGFGVAIEVRDNIKQAVANPRAAAWRGQVY